jgi:serine/threonine protein kinase
MPADPNLVRDLFLAAVELPAAERASYLAANASGDAEVRADVERLLAAHEQPAGVLVRPAPGIPTVDYAPIPERVGTKIGPYKLMEQIGEGGFGLVFVAEQTEPVRRKVALKVIKPGMDSQQVIARFEAERQALALMDHPNIARVLDAGATDSGRPYFVMELVRGIPITDYCDKNQLSPQERLELFITVCQAIQHAHQKGIIHRDVKPSNVLVTSHDGEPVAKVIDFGVAKAIHQHLTEQTIYTQFAQMIGTPLYMSPEQADMSGLDIDTRSDIYSLGVLLYELLTGTTPLEKKRFREAAYDEIRRLIREEEPPRPSMRLSTSESIAAVAAQRKMEPAKLSKLVRGDLDWITMKALEKDRTRRYETANGLARDIQRYLSDEPVEACPPSAGYRLRKFARKHRTVLTTAAAFVVLLTAGAAIATWQAVRATRAETLAVAAIGQLDAANKELKTTNQNLDTANQNLKATNQQLEVARQAANKAAAAEKQAADKERQAMAVALTRLKEIQKSQRASGIDLH